MMQISVINDFKSRHGLVMEKRLLCYNTEFNSKWYQEYQSCNKFRPKIKIWKPECLCRLFTDYVQNLQFVNITF